MCETCEYPNSRIRPCVSDSGKINLHVSSPWASGCVGSGWRVQLKVWWPVILSAVSARPGPKLGREVRQQPARVRLSAMRSKLIPGAWENLNPTSTLCTNPCLPACLHPTLYPTHTSSASRAALPPHTLITDTSHTAPRTVSTLSVCAFLTHGHHAFLA